LTQECVCARATTADTPACQSVNWEDFDMLFDKPIQPTVPSDTSEVEPIQEEDVDEDDDVSDEDSAPYDDSESSGEEYIEEKANRPRSIHKACLSICVPRNWI
jgi:hypothetical protein